MNSQHTLHALFSYISTTSRASLCTYLVLKVKMFPALIYHNNELGLVYCFLKALAKRE